jgi:hypothetical protein
MPADVDPHLINLLQGVLRLADSMRDAGVAGDITIQLGREDGLRILKLVAGANDPAAEVFSQQDRPQKHGVYSLNIAGVTVEWPRPNAPRQRPEASRMFSAAPKCVGVTANANSAAPKLRHYRGFEEEAPSIQ